MIGRLNHVAIAVPDLAAASGQYRTTFGAVVSEPQSMPDHGVTVVFVELPNTKIEFLEPLGEGSPINAFLEKSPAGGIHHICYEVDDILAARDRHRVVIGQKPGARLRGPSHPVRHQSGPHCDDCDGNKDAHQSTEISIAPAIATIARSSVRVTVDSGTDRIEPMQGQSISRPARTARNTPNVPKANTITVAP